MVCPRLCRNPGHPVRSRSGSRIRCRKMITEAAVAALELFAKGALLALSVFLGRHHKNREE